MNDDAVRSTEALKAIIANIDDLARVNMKAKYDEDIKKTLDSFLLEFPGVRTGKMFGYPAYYIGKKLLACVYENGVGIKVPQSLAGDLLKTEGIINF